MIFYVSAETSGYLTLPPGIKSIKVGNVEILLADKDKESEEPYVESIECFGAEVRNQGEPINLKIRAEVEAQSKEDAFRIGKIEIEAALDLVSLASGAAISPVYVSSTARYCSDMKLDFSKRVLVTQRDVFVWNEGCRSLLENLPIGMSKLPEIDKEILKRALRWRRKASSQDDIEMQFLFFWFAIESLAQMSFVKARPLEEQCKICQMPLVCSRCGKEQMSVSTSRKIRWLLTNTTHLWSKKECKEGYSLRSKVAHGNISITPDEEREIEKIIPKLNDSITEIIGLILNK